MSLILNALRRLESQFPSATAVAELPTVEAEFPAAGLDEQFAPEIDEPLAVEFDEPPALDAVGLDSLQFSVAEPGIDDWALQPDWAEPPEICISGTDLTADDVDVHVLGGDGTFEYPEISAFNEVETTTEEVAQIAEPADVVEEIDLGLPDEVIEEPTPDIIPTGIDEDTSEEDVILADDFDEQPATILSIAEFRSDEDADAETDEYELASDHELLTAHLTDLEFRGLRDNVLSQLPDGPATLLFAVPDEDTELGDVVARLADSLAQLQRGDVAVIYSSRLPGEHATALDSGARDRKFPPRTMAKISTVSIDPSETVGLFISDLKARYRWVLFAADAATARRWSSICDATYAVVALGNTHRQATLRAIHAMTAAGGHVLGCVLTSVPESA